MRFKNRYYLVEVVWEGVGPASASSSASSATAAAAASSSAGAAASSHRISDVSLQSYQLQNALREAMVTHFGEWGMARVMQSMQVRYLNSLTNLAILRVARSDSRTMAAIIACLTHIKQKSMLLKTIHMAGTIRSCQKRALALQHQRLQELQAQIAAVPEHAPLSAVLEAAAPTNAARRTAQQTVYQLSSLLSQYNAVKAQQAAAATSHAAAAAVASGASAAKIANKSEHTVTPNADAIQAAIQEIEQKEAKEIMLLEP